jgi:hypothetical protein
MAVPTEQPFLRARAGANMAVPRHLRRPTIRMHLVVHVGPLDAEACVATIDARNGLRARCATGKSDEIDSWSASIPSLQTTGAFSTNLT